MKIFDRLTVKAAEQEAFRSGIAYSRLMENAGTAAARFIRETVATGGKTAVVVCGQGNNGGDGLVIARKLHENGARVTVILSGGVPYTADAKEMFDRLPREITVMDYADYTDTCNRAIDGCDLLADAVFGTGLNRAPDNLTAALLARMSDSPAVTFAVDLPSGAVCDTGEIKGVCVKADYTVTFEVFKPCHILPPAGEYCGKTVAVGIGISRHILESLPAVAQTVDRPTLKKRRKNDHKGTFGTALSICGSYGMPGAAILSGRAALRCGVGILKAACVKENYTAFAASVPEAVLIPCDSFEGRYSSYETGRLKAALASSSAALIGCGLGVSDSLTDLIAELIKQSEVPLVLDADGINCIAGRIDCIRQAKAPLVLTPHPGEMARLCGKSVKEIEEDRLNTAADFARRFGVTLVLKGANTVVASPEGKLFVNLTGNPGMATGGSGDVLAGMILSFLAQGYDPLTAANTAVWLHSAAGDAAADRVGQPSLLPSDMIEQLPDLLKTL